MNKYHYLKNLTMLFEGKDNVYFDSMHYTEQGNQLIAKTVADMIMEEMRIVS